MLFPEYRPGSGWVDVCDLCGLVEIPTEERMIEIREMIDKGILKVPA